MIPRRTLLGTAGAALLAPRAWATTPVTATPVTLAISSSTLAYGGLRIAENAGLFSRNGLDARIVVMDSGNAALSAVLGGSAQFAASGPGEVLAARLRGRDMLVVANVYHGLSGSMLLTKAAAAKTGVAPDAPVAQRLRAVSGLSIAEPSPTSAYLHPYKAAAEEVGATMRVVYMAQPAMVAALKAGAVDGAVLGSPFAQSAIRNGSSVPWISGPRDELPASVRTASSACLQATAEYNTANKPVIAALRQVLADLAAFLRDKPAEATELLGRAYKTMDPDSLNDAFAENWRNWAQPALTVAEMRQEIAIQEASGTMPGVGKMDPASVLLP